MVSLLFFFFNFEILHWADLLVLISTGLQVRPAYNVKK